MIDMKLRAPAEVSEPSAGRGLLYLGTDGAVRVRLSDGTEPGESVPVCRKFSVTMPAVSATVSISHSFAAAKLISFNVACQSTSLRYVMPGSATAADAYSAAATQTQVTLITGPSATNIAGKPAVITVWGYL